jgi:hypothetical protein
MGIGDGWIAVATHYKEKKYAGSENHSPHEVKNKKATLVLSTVKLLNRRQ